MEQIIRLLPDNIANQIAAGEVVQRPASVVKELMENSLDAGATQVDLLIKDAGKALIQVIDNGSGMSAADARMAFERHATSKIRESADLFNIRTMGFRGEAMASIAAVAQVHLKTRLANQELGTEVVIEGSEFKKQQPVLTPFGTIISVKNLFFNVPARRNFLKSNPVETRHVLNEFIRIALAYPEFSFSFNHNGTDVYRLTPTDLPGRITQLFGAETGEQVFAIGEGTPYVTIHGVVGAPDVARKTRGDQFFFVNHRFIKSHYLHHAVTTAYQNLLDSEQHPFYCIFLEIDPSHIDINIHPTKSEIKFDDERTVYGLLHSVVKKGLGDFHRAPVMDWEDQGMKNLIGKTPPPVENKTPTVSTFHKTERKESFSDAWEKLFESPITGDKFLVEQREPERKPSQFSQSTPSTSQHSPKLFREENQQDEGFLVQLHQKYLMLQAKDGLLVIDQHLAHQRIIFERMTGAGARPPAACQQLLFPKTLTFSPTEFSYLREIEPKLRHLGFDMREFGPNSYILSGIPADLAGSKVEQYLEEIITEVHHTGDTDASAKLFDALAKSIAKRSAFPSGKKLSPAEMRDLATKLFECDQPGVSPGGKPTYYRLGLTDLAAFFQRNSF